MAKITDLYHPNEKHIDCIETLDKFGNVCYVSGKKYVYYPYESVENILNIPEGKFNHRCKFEKFSNYMKSNGIYIYIVNNLSKSDCERGTTKVRCIKKTDIPKLLEYQTRNRNFDLIDAALEVYWERYR